MEEPVMGMMRKLRHRLKFFWKRVLIPFFLGMMSAEVFHLFIASKQEYVLYKMTKYAIKASEEEPSKGIPYHLPDRSRDFLLKKSTHHSFFLI